jgi:hypothetical protein
VKLMEMVQHTNGAQFSPAGVLRLPAPASSGTPELLADLKEKLAALA